MVPGGSLDHQVLCFPTNLKGSVPRVPDANLVQLFKSSLGQAFQHQSLESPWRSLEDPWRLPGGSLELRAAPWWVPGSPWSVPGGSLGVPGGFLGVPGGVPGGTKYGGASLGVSWDGPGKPLVCCWRYGAILGPVPRDQHVAISFVLTVKQPKR